MLYFQIDPEIFQNEGRYVVTDVAEHITDADRRTGDWLCRCDFQSLDVAKQIAETATAYTGAPYVATDSGGSCYPRFDVVRAPFVEVLDEDGWRYSKPEAVERIRADIRAEYENNLRDQFAMAALTGLLSNAEASASDGRSWRTGTLAGDAYAFADDALLARKR